ncbi:SCO family protein, partial [Massilia horti]|uniref:SCO family protein n=1 Tax=Massilia horti TaxID=2562153 RepID=UPI0014305074
LEQRPGARLPLDARFVDDAGRAVRLGRYFGAAPVLLVLGYYRCADLCSTVMDGVLHNLAMLGLPAGGVRVVAVSIDPQDDAAGAARKRQAYAPLLGDGAIQLDLLTGARPALQRLAAATGFHYAYDAAHQRYLHPAGFLVASADGVITHYFPGAGFDKRDLRLALVQASRGQIGSVADRIALLCSHFDPATGRYTGLAWNLARGFALLVATLLAAVVWRLRRRERRRA